MGSHAVFHTAPIRSFAPPQPPDIVLALHACDTATGARARGVGRVFAPRARRRRAFICMAALLAGLR